MSSIFFYTCCICGKKREGFGNNPEPVMPECENGKRNRCCDSCNAYVVIPARMKEANERHET